jgi:hypothetical protein
MLYLIGFGGRPVQTLLLIFIIALAGCAGTPAPDSATPSPQETSSPTRTPVSVQPVIVAINNPTNRTYEPLVKTTINYWQRNDEKYGDYTTNWSLQPNAADANVIIQFQSDINQCDLENTTQALGCAPLLGKSPDSGIPTHVQIKTGYTNNSTLVTLKHEFGHLYGIEHGEQPMPLMAPYATANLTAQPNATKRAIPWQSDRIRLYIEVDSFESPHKSEQLIRSELYEQANNTLAYFNDAKGTVPQNVTVERVWARSEADIIVKSNKIGDESASTSSVFGRSTDSDAALEYYTNATIEIHPDVPDDQIGYHIGYWVDSFVNPDEVSEPFEKSNRRKDWWRAY